MNNKMIKSSKIIDKILKIIQGFMIAGIIVSAVFIPLAIILGEKIVIKTNSFALGDLDIKVEDIAYMDLTHVKASIVATMILAIITCIIMYFGLKVLRSIVATMKEGRPFEEGVSLKIRKLAWIALIGGGICEVGRAVSTSLEVGMYDLFKIFNSGVVKEVSADASINFTFVILAVVLFVLSYVFKYGEGLQKESDETL